MVRWVKDKHGIWRSPDPRPVDTWVETAPPRARETTMDREGFCVDCDQPINKRGKRCRPCYDELRGVGQGHRRTSPEATVDQVMTTLARTLHPRLTLGVTCDCGCLLVSHDEMCPSCLVWAELNAARASWERAVEPYKPSVETVVLEAA